MLAFSHTYMRIFNPRTHCIAADVVNKRARCLSAKVSAINNNTLGKMLTITGQKRALGILGSVKGVCYHWDLTSCQSPDLYFGPLLATSKITSVTLWFPDKSNLGPVHRYGYFPTVWTLFWLLTSVWYPAAPFTFCCVLHFVLSVLEDVLWEWNVEFSATVHGFKCRSPCFKASCCWNDHTEFFCKAVYQISLSAWTTNRSKSSLYKWSGWERRLCSLSARGCDFTHAPLDETSWENIYIQT